jgi:hypothetical protein
MNNIQRTRLISFSPSNRQVIFDNTLSAIAPIQFLLTLDPTVDLTLVPEEFTLQFVSGVITNTVIVPANFNGNVETILTNSLISLVNGYWNATSVPLTIYGPTKYLKLLVQWLGLILPAAAISGETFSYVISSSIFPKVANLITPTSSVIQYESSKVIQTTLTTDLTVEIGGVITLSLMTYEGVEVSFTRVCIALLSMS